MPNSAPATAVKDSSSWCGTARLRSPENARESAQGLSSPHDPVFLSQQEIQGRRTQINAVARAIPKSLAPTITYITATKF